MSEDLNLAAMAGGEEYENPDTKAKGYIVHRGLTSVIKTVPYAFTIGAVSFAGTLYMTNPLDQSFTDGLIGGILIGTYHIDKNRVEFHADNGLLQAQIQIDVNAKHIRARLCSRNIDGGWGCPSWSDILRW